MRIVEAEHALYNKIVNNPYHVFNSADFNLLNNQKCEKLFFLLFEEQKYRLGLVAGLREGILNTPFSAPFGSYSHIGGKTNLTTLENAIDATEEFAREQKIKGIRHILPPLIYGDTFIAQLTNILYRKQYQMTNCDISHYFPLDKFDATYPKSLPRNARKNLAIALKSNLEFKVCDTENQKEKAYSIIKINRKAKAFPLRMSYDDIQATAKHVTADFFLVKKNDDYISAAIVFRVAPRIQQVIYWGDAPGFQEFKPMNFLSFKIFEHYKTQDLDFVDIGPSTEDSIPNYGLNDFKESIGCNISPKFTFFKRIA